MPSLNKVMIIGNAGRDAELKYTASGKAMVTFSVAVNHRQRNRSGDWEDASEWFSCVLFGDTAEKVNQYITKGKPVYVEGRLQTRKWSDDQGGKHERTELIANTVQLLGGKEPGEGRAAPMVADDLPFD